MGVLFAAAVQRQEMQDADLVVRGRNVHAQIVWNASVCYYLPFRSLIKLHVEEYKATAGHKVDERIELRVFDISTVCSCTAALL